MPARKKTVKEELAAEEVPKLLVSRVGDFVGYEIEMISGSWGTYKVDPETGCITERVDDD